MDSDKVIFTIIGGVTALILAVIFATSFLKQSSDVALNSDDSLLIDVSSGHRTGSENPKLILVEFSDFECPSCKLYEPIVQSLLQKYPNDLALIYRHFPLPSHRFAIPAARASEAAALQGKFWEYALILFENQPKFLDDELLNYASELGLDIDKFKNDFKSKPVADAVNNDYQLANRLNLPGTPTFFLINGDSVKQLNLQLEGDLEKQIEDVLGPAETQVVTP